MTKVLISFIVLSFYSIFGCTSNYTPTISVAPNTTIIDVEPNETIEVITKGKDKDSVIQSPTKKITIRDSLEKVFLSYVGVRERTGHNDGKEVEMFLKSVGLKKGYSWCSAFVSYCFKQVGINTTITAWSPTAENKADIVYKKNKFYREPLSGDVGTLYYQSLGRIGHTFFYYKRHNEKMYKSVEGNTNGEGSRNGDGVYIKYRSFRGTYSISNWIKD